MDKLEDLPNDVGNLFPIFANTIEFKLLTGCIDAFKNSDQDAFTKAVISYDSIKPLDPKQVKLLNEIKQIIIY